MGVDELQRGQPHRHGVDREVTADQVVHQVVTEGDHGLAAPAVVGVRAIGGDLDDVRVLAGADRAEGPAHVPVVVSPAGQDRLALVGCRRCGQVKVRGHPAQEGVTHWPAHEGDLMTGVDEPGAQLGQQRQDRGQPTHRLTQEGIGQIGGSHESQG